MFNRWNGSFLGLLLFLSTGLISCTSSPEYGSDPKGRLTEYVSRSFSVKAIEDKKALLAFLTGGVKTRLEGWSDDQFREAFVDSKRKFEKLLIREVKPISKSEVQITYELTFHDLGKGKENQVHESKVTNKKLCQMVLENDTWYISDVRNIKELIEYQNELSF
jgi:hypothetical protein